MFGKSWINKVLSPLGAIGQRRPKGHKAKATQCRRLRLGLEVLEDRSLPSAIIVTNNTDVTDGDTSSIAALINNRGGADETISLREAILASNNTPGANSIAFDPVTCGMPIWLEQGYLEIKNSVTITGLGAVNTSVSGESLARIIYIAPAATGFNTFDVTLDGLTLTGGRASDGGAIRTSESSTLLTVKNSTVSDNRADSGIFPFSAAGGGIWSYGAVTVINSTVSRNSGSTGGGIYAQGAVTIIDSTISGNSVSGFGGGIYSAGALTIHNSTVSANVAYGGGGMEARGNVTISNSTVSQNSANSNWAGGGIEAVQGATVTIINSTIADNYAGYGGGIFADGPVTVINSTVTRNLLAELGGGIFSIGAVTVSNSTIFGNSANFAGGIYGDDAVTIRNSIVAGNLDNDGAPEFAVGSSLSVTNSLIGDNSGTGLEPTLDGAPDGNGNFIGNPDAPIDPLLGPLADNGGPTQTMAMLPNSPALNNGSNALAVDATGNLLPFDQRGPGFARISGGRVDIGAFEVIAPMADLQVKVSPVKPDPVLEGQEFSYTITVTNRGPQAATNVVVEDAQKNPIFGLGLLKNGEQASFLVTKTAGVAGTFNETIVAFAEQQDTNLADNTQTVKYQVIAPVADLQVTVSPVTPDPVLEGQELSYTITVTNIGPETATNVVVVYVATNGAKKPIFAPGTLKNGEQAFFLVTETAGTAGAYRDTYYAVADQEDRNPDNDIATVEYEVTARATPTFGALTSPTIVVGTGFATLGGRINLGASGTVAITVGTIKVSAAIHADGTFSATMPTATLPAGSYTITYSYGGDGNFNPASATQTLVVLTAQQQLALIVDQVNALVDARILDKGSGNALTKLLTNAIASLKDKNTTARVSQLKAATNIVKSSKLTTTDAETLISGITEAITAVLASPI